MTYYYVAKTPNGELFGTYSIKEVIEAVASGWIKKDYVATEAGGRVYRDIRDAGNAKWVVISGLLVSNGITLPEPAPTPPPTSVTPNQLPVQTPSEAPVASGAHQESTSWVYLIEGQQTKGPFTMGQLRSMWSTGSITVMTMHCRSDDPQPKPLSSILHLLEPSASAPISAGAKPVAIPHAAAPSVGPSSVGGWLTFFCVSITILAPSFFLILMIKDWSGYQLAFTTNSTLQTAAILELFGSIVLLIYGIVVGCRIWGGDPNGRTMAQQYLWINLVGFIGLMLIVAALTDSLGVPDGNDARARANAIKDGIIGRLVFCGNWLAYFKYSKRVRNTYGEERA